MANAAFTGLLLGFRFIATLPFFIALVMFIITPGYFRPVVQQPLGILMLLLAACLAAAGYWTAGQGLKQFRLRRIGIGLLLWAVSIFLCSFPALWLVLIGPALFVLAARSA